VLFGVRTVEPRQSLHRPDARERLVHVHGVQERLVVAGLEHVGADQEAIRSLGDLVLDLLAGESVEGSLGHLRSAELVLAGERDDGAAGALSLLEVLRDRTEILDGAANAARDDHRSGFPADLLLAQHLIVEVVHHDLRLLADRVIVGLDVPAELLLRFLGVELRVVLHRLGEPVVALHRSVVLEHVQDEALLDRLLPRVAVERAVLDLLTLRPRVTKDLQRLVLGRRGEGEVARVRQHLPREHDPVDGVFGGLVLLLTAPFRQGDVHHGRRSAALAGVRLVNQDGEAAASMRVADLVEDERELLDGRDDDLLAVLEERPEISRAFGMANRRLDLS